MKFKRDEKSSYDTGLHQGQKKGVKEGIEIGEKNKEIQTVKAMLRERASLEFISKVTNLTLEQIENIKNDN